VIEYMCQPRGVIVPQQRYEEVADDLLRRIRSGEIPPGAKLPSRAELGKEYDVSDSVIGKAMIIVRATGLVETLEGVGVYVRERDEPTG
jgi:GntR family transcriptional regulator